MCFLEEIPDYDLPMDLGDGSDGVILPDTYMNEMDMIGTGRILDTAPRWPHSTFDMFGVSMIDSDDVTLYDACTDVMDMIGTGRILDAFPPGPRSAFDVFRISMLEFDGDELVATDITHDTVSIEGASDSVDPPLSFDTDSCPIAPTTHVCDVDDVGDTDDPLSGQSKCDSDSIWRRKVTPISAKTELIDFGAPDQPRELRIGSSLSPDERSRLIDLLRSYLDVFAWSYEDIVGFLSVVEYPEWLANVVPVPKKDGKILMALEDMEKTSFITEWGTYCYRVMPFGLKNVGATYQRTTTTLFHDMMHIDIEVYVDDMIVKLNPKKCTFGVTSGKLLGHIVSERGIEVDPKKIRVILDMPALRTEREIRGFLGVSLLSSALVPPTFGRPLLLIHFKHGFGMHCLYLALVWATRRLRHYVIEYSILLVSRLDPLRYLFDRPVLTGRLMRWLVLLIEFDIQPIDDDFLNEQFVSVTSIAGWRLYFDGAANQLGFGIGILLISPQGDHIPRSILNNIIEYEACITGLETALDLGVRQLEIHGDSNLVIQHTQGIWRTRDEKLKLYHAYLDLLVDRFKELRYIHLPRAENQFVDALATLASVIEIPAGVTVRSLLLKTRPAPAYYCLIGDIEDQDELPWYHDIYQFLLCGAYPESASTKDRRALRQLATRFVICGESLYRRSLDGLLLLCLDRVSADRVMREVHVGMHGDLIHMPPSELHALTSPWPFSVWGIDVIGKISPKSSNGHEYILAANKNIKRILRKMVKTSRDWSEKLHFSLWAYCTSFRTSTGATPYSLVYGMEAVLLVEIEMGSLRVALEHFLDKRRLRATDHVQAYQRKMTRAFRKRVKPRKFQKGDLILKASGD
ncbi:hypothetical protein AAG906_041213 [Vitis piasezkii]